MEIKDSHMVMKQRTACNIMQTMPLSTNGNAIYGKGPQENLGGLSKRGK